jgi:hypothetical protein
MDILHINKKNKKITFLILKNQNKIENKSKTKNYLAKENTQKKTKHEKNK